MHQNFRCLIDDDGETSHDFCYVENVVQANLLATRAGQEATGEIYHVSCNAQATLDQLYALLRDKLRPFNPFIEGMNPQHRDF